MEATRFKCCLIKAQVKIEARIKKQAKCSVLGAPPLTERLNLMSTLPVSNSLMVSARPGSQPGSSWMPTAPANPWGSDVYASQSNVSEPIGGSGEIAAAPGLSRRDTEALVRAVAAEARGESPEVWVAVAQTIINYARRYGQPISNLVRTSYLSSNYDHNKTFFTMPLSHIPRLGGIEHAVHRAATGASPIGSRRVHFHDVSISTPSFGNPATATRIGRMVFFEPRH